MTAVLIDTECAPSRDEMVKKIAFELKAQAVSANEIANVLNGFDKNNKNLIVLDSISNYQKELNMTYTVEFTKTFTDGNLKGISFPSSLSFPDLNSAKEYVDFLNQHATVPYKVPKWAGTGSWLCTNVNVRIKE